MNQDLNTTLTTGITDNRDGTFSVIDTSGYITNIGGYVPTSPNWITETKSYYTLPYDNYFNQLAKTFNLNITEEQGKMLDELMNTGEEANKIIACETFKYLLNNKG